MTHQFTFSRDDLTLLCEALDALIIATDRPYSEVAKLRAEFGRVLYPPHVLPAAERVRLFHVGRGCCDGTDIDACAIARAAAETERTRKAKGRPREDDEYADTAPSEEYQEQIRAGSAYADMSLMCRNPIHHNGRHRMGDKCPDCGFVF